MLCLVTVFFLFCPLAIGIWIVVQERFEDAGDDPKRLPDEEAEEKVATVVVNPLSSGKHEGYEKGDEDESIEDLPEVKSVKLVQNVVAPAAEDSDGGMPYTVLVEARVRAGVGLNCEVVRRIAAGECVTICKEVYHSGHHRGRIGSDDSAPEWVSIQTDTGRVLLRPGVPSGDEHSAILEEASKSQGSAAALGNGLYEVKAGKEVSVRKNASVESKQVRTLHAGECVEVVETASVGEHFRARIGGTRLFPICAHKTSLWLSLLLLLQMRNGSASKPKPPC